MNEVKSAMKIFKKTAKVCRVFFDRLVVLLKQWRCQHTFNLSDLEKTNIPEPIKPDNYEEWESYWNEYYYGDWNTKRVRWPCSKCGKVFYAHCGLDISPEHGPVV